MQKKDALSYLYGLGEKELVFNPSADQKVEEAYERVVKLCQNDNYKVYGIHTGYGFNVKDAKDPKNWKDDQIELLKYLQVGVGEDLPERVVRRALRIQALKISRGFSGTSPEAYKALIELSQSDQLPVVPRYGSLGASGDLVSMAHAIDPIYENISPKGPRDVISMVNTNSMMTSLAIENYKELQNLLIQTIKFFAQVSIGIDANMEHMDIEGYSMNPQEEPKAVCEAVQEERKRFLEKNLIEERGDRPCIQEKYSFRCAPYVLGQIFRNLKYVQELLEDEAYQVSDNPIVLKNGKPWHGGHFYAIGIATASDLMSDACVRISEIIDRNVLNLMDPELSKGLATNLQVDRNDHLKGIHQTISSLHQRVRSLNYNSAQMSFSCESNNQDVVPCGMNAQNQLTDMLKVLTLVIKAGLFCSERAALMRLEEHVPTRLRLSEWRHFYNEQFI